MNYFEHHIGDYAEATSHLTFVEDAAYSRMIRKYYAREAPLPVDVQAVQRLVGARTKEERDAVVVVLNEFFELRDDGWHQHTCDETISAYRDGEPEREAKRSNEDLRMKRHREERAALFKRLNSAGGHAPWNMPMAELRALVAKTCNAVAGENCNEPETPPATAPATPATATQSPSPTTHLPSVGKSEDQKHAAAGASAGLRLVPDEGPKPSRFDEFWSVYPLKEAKADARKAWRTRNCDAKADQIIADVKRRKLKHKRWLDGFIPHPATYLRGERWGDAIVEGDGHGPGSSPSQDDVFAGSL